MFPGPTGLMIVLNIMTWPKPLSESREEAREIFFSAGPDYAATPHVAGKAQVDAFLGGLTAAEMRLAWIPSPGHAADLPVPLRRTLLPWGTEPPRPEQALIPGTGGDIVDLARASAQLLIGMQHLLNAWPDEDLRPTFGFRNAREKVKSSVPDFNAAVKRLGLGHLMPLSEWDDTWKPHNLRQFAPFPLRSDKHRG